MTTWINVGLCCILLICISEVINGQPGCTIGDTTCATCDSTNTNCLSCFNGQQLTTTSPVKCVPCFSKCLTCSKTDQPCIVCDNLHGPDSSNIGQCAACSTSNCEGICNKNGAGKCDICVYTYGVGTNGLCEKCPANCQTCGAKNTSYCDVCVTSFVVRSGVCLKCPANCSKCDLQGPDKCDSGGCQRGFETNAEGFCQAITTVTPRTTATSRGTTAMGPTTGTTLSTSTSRVTTTVASTTPVRSSAASSIGGSTASIRAEINLSTIQGGLGGSTTVQGGPGGSTTTDQDGPGGSTVSDGSTTQGSGTKSGLSDGEVIGIIVGSIAGLLALLLLCLCCWYWIGKEAEYVQERPNPYTCARNYYPTDFRRGLVYGGIRPPMRQIPLPNRGYTCYRI